MFQKNCSLYGFYVIILVKIKMTTFYAKLWVLAQTDHERRKFWVKSGIIFTPNNELLQKSRHILRKVVILSHSVWAQLNKFMHMVTTWLGLEHSTRGLFTRHFDCVCRIKPKHRFGKVLLFPSKKRERKKYKILQNMVQWLTIAIVFELIYYTNGDF